MPTVPLAVELRVMTTSINLNDSTNYEIGRDFMTRPFTPLSTNKAKVYEDVEEFFTVNILGTNYQQVQNNLDALFLFASRTQHIQRGNTYSPLHMEVTISGSYSYATHIKNITIELPETNMQLAVLRGINAAKLTVLHGPWFLSADGVDIDSSGTSSGASLPGTFSASFTTNHNYSSPLSFYMYPFSHQYTRVVPKMIVAVSNSPYALTFIDLSNTTGKEANFSVVSDSTAFGFSYIRKTVLTQGQAVTFSGLDQIRNFPSASESIAIFQKAHVFGTVRCTGDWLFSAGIRQNQQVTFADPQLITATANPTAMYLGTITSSRFLDGSAAFRLTSLSTSGSFDIDVMGFVGVADDNTSVFTTEQFSLSGIDPGGIGLLNVPLRVQSILSDITFDGKPKLMYAERSSPPTYTFDDMQYGAAEDQFYVPSYGSLNLQWKTNQQLGAINSVEKSVYAMVFATGTTSEWTFRNISGVQPQFNMTFGRIRAWPYFPRI